VNLNARESEDQFAEAGWHCCRMAPTIEATTLGWGEDVLDRALSRLLEVTSGDSNAIEITGITTLQFRGLHYVSISALARHVGKEPVSRAAPAFGNDFPARNRQKP
jgi:hypothetical protein